MIRIGPPAAWATIERRGAGHLVVIGNQRMTADGATRPYSEAVARGWAEAAVRLLRQRTIASEDAALRMMESHFTYRAPRRAQLTLF